MSEKIGNKKEVIKEIKRLKENLERINMDLKFNPHEQIQDAKLFFEIGLAIQETALDVYTKVEEAKKLKKEQEKN